MDSRVFTFNACEPPVVVRHGRTNRLIVSVTCSLLHHYVTELRYKVEEEDVVNVVMT